MIEAIIVYALRLFVLMLPFTAIGVLGDVLGIFMYYIATSRRKIARENVRRVYGSALSKVKKERIVRGSFKNVGRVFLELLWISKINRKNYSRIIKLDGKAILDKAFARGKGVLFMTAHFGNWEYEPFGCTFEGYKLANVFVPVKNRFLNQLLFRLRSHTGAELIKKGYDIRRIREFLKQNYGIGLLIDQAAGRRGLRLRFLGQEASTPRGLYTLAKRYGAYVVGVFMIREKNRYRLKLIDVGGPEEGENEMRFMQRMNDLISEYIKQYPENWFWIHRRFK